MLVIDRLSGKQVEFYENMCVCVCVCGDHDVPSG